MSGSISSKMQEKRVNGIVRPGAGPIKILLRKFCATQIFRHSDWSKILTSQSKCLTK